MRMAHYHKNRKAGVYTYREKIQQGLRLYRTQNIQLSQG